MIPLPRFVCCSIVVLCARLESQAPSVPTSPSATPVEPSESLAIPPAAEISWSRIVMFDLELAKGGLEPEYPTSPELLPEVIYEVPGPAHPGARPSSGPAAAVPIVGGCAGDFVEPPLSNSFLALPDNNTRIPPDTNGAVGPAHVMTMLNDRVRIQDRTGGVVSTVTLLAFWAAVGGTDVFDPKLVYDAQADRWYATACADRRSASSRVLFAASASGDPTGIWNFYSFDGDAGNATWVDFPGFGFNSRWIVITENMFANVGDAFQGVKMWALDRATVLAGGALTVSVFPTAFDLTPSGGRGSTIVPCVTYDAAETTLYLVNNNFSSGTLPLIRLSRLTGTGPAPVWSVAPGSSFADGGFFQVILVFGRNLNDAPQLGDPRLIDTNDTRILGAVVRNGSVWLTHSGDQAGVTGVLWYQVNPAGLPFPIVQSNFVWNFDAHQFYPSIAVNCAGDMCLGFTRSGSTRYAEGVYLVRLGTGIGGLLVRQLKAGEDWYFKDFGTGRNRWGDYSVTVVDPVDDKSFWTIQEYARTHNGAGDAGSRWGTWWGRIGSCGAPSITDQPDPLTLCEGQPVSFSVSATASNAPLAYQWRKNGSDLAGQTSSVLSLGAATLADAGSYDVRIQDGCGEVTSLPAVLSVSQGVTLTQQPAGQGACVGALVKLSVAATGPGLGYQWRKDGGALGGQTSSSLALGPMTPADAGSYDVVVTASTGCAVTSAPAVLTVEEVTITQQPQGLFRCVGQGATFAVVATGSGLTYQWRKNGVALPGKTQSTLGLAALGTTDSGSYDVVVGAPNGCTKTSAAATLVVESCHFLPKKL